MGDDQRKPGLPLDGLTDAEIEAMAKASVAELAVHRFVSDDVNTVEMGERRARMRATRDKGRRDQRLEDGLGRDYGDARAWAQPRGRADIAPSRHDGIEGDGYLTLDAPWLVPALLRSIPEISGRILEPAAGRGHISLELRRAGFDVVSRDIRSYLVPLVDGIGVGDIRELESLAGFDWVVTNLPYRDLTELTAHLTRLGARDRCCVALLVRAEWLFPKARRHLLHEHPHFAGAVMLTARPRWFERGDGGSGPRHNFAWVVWSGTPRVGDPWLRFVGKPERKPMQLALFEEGT
jgi:hypothetical protein